MFEFISIGTDEDGMKVCFVKKGGEEFRVFYTRSIWGIVPEILLKDGKEVEMSEDDEVDLTYLIHKNID